MSEKIVQLSGYKVDRKGPPGDDGGMDDRLKKLEQAVSVIEAKLPDLATNDGVDARLSRTETKIILWVVGAVVATGLGGKFLNGFSGPAQSNAPIVIQVPSSPPSTAPTVAPSAPPSQK